MPKRADLDAILIEVAPEVNGQPGSFRPIFVWGDNRQDNNGELRDLVDQPSLTIPADRLRSGAGMAVGTGIGLDIGGDDGAHYRYVRITRYTTDGTPPPSGRLAQVDAIERQNFPMAYQDNDDASPSPMTTPTTTGEPASPTTTPTTAGEPPSPTTTPTTATASI